MLGFIGLLFKGWMSGLGGIGGGGMGCGVLIMSSVIGYG